LTEGFNGEEAVWMQSNNLLLGCGSGSCSAALRNIKSMAVMVTSKSYA
jgi:hypothetical protein